MKKSIVFLLFATAFLLSSCEQPEAPQSLIGHWHVVGDHWTATFDDEGELYISSTKYDTALPYYYYATSDSVYISTICYAEDNQEVYGNPYACSYYFKNNNTLVIDGFNYVYEKPLGTITQNRVDERQVVLRRTSYSR